MRGCFYLPLDEAGGGVGGCAAIRAFEAALAFRQLPGQLRASRRHKVQPHTLVFLLFPRHLPVQPPPNTNVAARVPTGPADELGYKCIFPYGACQMIKH